LRDKLKPSRRGDGFFRFNFNPKHFSDISPGFKKAGDQDRMLYCVLPKYPQNVYDAD